MIFDEIDQNTNLVAVGTETEVLHGLPSVLRATEKDDVRARWRTESELVESQALTTRLDDTGTCSGRETERADGHLRDLEHAVVVEDATDHGYSATLVRLL